MSSLIHIDDLRRRARRDLGVVRSAVEHRGPRELDRRPAWPAITLAATFGLSLLGLTWLVGSQAEAADLRGGERALARAAEELGSRVGAYQENLITTGRSLEDNPVFVDLVRTLRTNPGDHTAQTDAVAWLTTLLATGGHVHADVVDADGHGLVAVPDAAPAPCPVPSVNPGQIAVTTATAPADPRSGTGICLVVPIRSTAGDGVIAWVLLLTDAPAPLTMPSFGRLSGFATEATFVVGADGTNALYRPGFRLSDVAAVPGSPGALHRGRLTYGATGTTDVYAVFAPVAGTPWQVAASVSTAELESHAWVTALLATLGALLLFGGLVATVRLLWRRHEQIRVLERDRAEELYAWLADAVEVGRDGVLIVDPETLEIAWANRGASDLLGRTSEEIRAVSLDALDRSLSRADHLKVIAGLQSAPGTESVRVTLLRMPDGSGFWAEIRVQLVTADASSRALVWVHDITDRHERDQERDWLLAAIEHSSDGVIVADRDKGVRYANAAIARITGVDRDAIYGCSLVDLLQPAGGATDPWVLLEGHGTWTGSVTARGATNGVPDAEWSMTAVTDRCGDRSGTVVVARDRHRERRLEAQVARSQRLEAVGQLAAGIAHDFNNLLTAVLGYAEIVRKDAEPSGEAYADLSQIIAAGERGAALVRQLLAFSRRQVLQPHIVKTNDVVAGVVPMLRRLLGEDVELETRLDDEPGSVLADPTQLEQVLVNLATNARDAMPGGGTLTIETRQVYLDEEYARVHADVHPGQFSMIAVSDTGTGMDPATLAHMFEPFFTTKGPDRGTGLGLATVHGIVRQSGGHVWAYSELHQGTTFKIYLPAVESSDQSAPPPAASASAGGGETILVVEDEAPVRDLAVRILRERGYRVLQNENPHGALARSAAELESVDLLVTDIVMPGLSGPELAAILIDRVPGLRVLCMSGYTEHSAAHQGLTNVASDFMSKPFALETLSRKVRDLLDGRSVATGEV